MCIGSQMHCVPFAIAVRKHKARSKNLLCSVYNTNTWVTGFFWKIQFAQKWKVVQKAAGQRWCPGCISDGNCVKVQVVGIILGTLVLIPDSQGAALQFAQLTLHGVTMLQISGVMLSQRTELQCIYGSGPSFVYLAKGQLCFWRTKSRTFPNWENMQRGVGARATRTRPSLTAQW